MVKYETHSQNPEVPEGLIKAFSDANKYIKQVFDYLLNQPVTGSADYLEAVDILVNNRSRYLYEESSDIVADEPEPLEDETLTEEIIV